VALLLVVGNGTDGITIQYCNVALLLGTGNLSDGIKLQHCSVALLFGAGNGSDGLTVQYCCAGSPTQYLCNSMLRPLRESPPARNWFS